MNLRRAPPTHYDRPTRQVASSQPTQQEDSAMPPGTTHRDTRMTPAVPTPATERIQLVPPTLPLTQSTSVMRSGSEDIEGERPARARAPFPRHGVPPRPSSPQLSQQPQEEPVPVGYLIQQVAYFERFQLRQQLIIATSVYEQRQDEMMRHSIAYQHKH